MNREKLIDVLGNVVYQGRKFKKRIAQENSKFKKWIKKNKITKLELLTVLIAFIMIIADIALSISYPVIGSTLYLLSLTGLIWACYNITFKALIK